MLHRLWNDAVNEEIETAFAEYKKNHAGIKQYIFYLLQTSLLLHGCIITPKKVSPLSIYEKTDKLSILACCRYFPTRLVFDNYHVLLLIGLHEIRLAFSYL